MRESAMQTDTTQRPVLLHVYMKAEGYKGAWHNDLRTEPNLGRVVRFLIVRLEFILGNVNIESYKTIDTGVL